MPHHNPSPVSGKQERSVIAKSLVVAGHLIFCVPSIQPRTGPGSQPRTGSPRCRLPPLLPEGNRYADKKTSSGEWLKSHIAQQSSISGAEMVVDLCHTIGLHERASEEPHVFYLNTKNAVIGMELVSKGTLNASLVHPREVYKGALLANANAIMVVHNHHYSFFAHGLIPK